MYNFCLIDCSFISNLYQWLMYLHLMFSPRLLKLFFDGKKDTFVYVARVSGQWQDWQDYYRIWAYRRPMSELVLVTRTLIPSLYQQPWAGYRALPNSVMLYYQVSVSCELRSNRVKWGVNFNPQIIVTLLTVNVAYSLAKFSSISMVSFQMPRMWTTVSKQTRMKS